MSRRYFAFTALAATLSALSSSSCSPRFFRRFTGGVPLMSSLVGALGVSRSLATAQGTGMPSSFSFLDSVTAKAIDEELMGEEGGFQLEQLMELAGLSVASAAQDMLCAKQHPDHCRSGQRVLVICGPGNNGGDGLVAARHLYHLGHKPTILYPKRGKSKFFNQLCKQCSNLDIPILDSIPADELVFNEYDLIIDAMFGFSFRGPIREPYNKVLAALVQVSGTPHVLSVDIPSGWSVEEGDVFKTGFSPTAVVSLTAPKQCMKNFNGDHYLGGRFVPEKLQRKYDLSLPNYDSTSLTQVYKFPNSAATSDLGPVSSDWVLYLTAEGYPYYYHPASGDSRWASFAPTPHNHNSGECHVEEGCQEFTEKMQDHHSSDLTNAYNSGHMINQYHEKNVKSMQKDDDLISMYISTAGDTAEAQRLANHLVTNKLAACVNIVPGVMSVYEWEGKLEESTEAMMIVKTRRSLTQEVTAALKKHHSYDVPEGIVVDLSTKDLFTGKSMGNEDYTQWVRYQTRAKDK